MNDAHPDQRILARYGYLPDKQEKATQTVLGQVEALCQDWAVASWGTIEGGMIWKEPPSMRST